MATRPLPAILGQTCYLIAGIYLGEPQVCANRVCLQNCDFYKHRKIFKIWDIYVYNHERQKRP